MGKTPEPFPMGAANCFGGSRSSHRPWETLPSPHLSGGVMGGPYKPIGTSRAGSCSEEKPGRTSDRFVMVREVQGIRARLSVLASETAARGVCYRRIRLRLGSGGLCAERGCWYPDSRVKQRLCT